MGACDLEEATDLQASLVSHPISLKDAIKHGVFSEVNDYAINDLGEPHTQCWVTWDEKWIEKKSYFNPKTKVVSEVVADWENGGRPALIGGDFDGEVEAPKDGYSPMVRDHFALYPLGVAHLDAKLQQNGNLDDFVPTSKDMCRCLFQDESAWMGDGGY